MSNEPDNKKRTPKYPKAPLKKRGSGDSGGNAPQNNNWRGLIFFIIAAFMLLIFLALSQHDQQKNKDTLDFPAFLENLKAGNVTKVTFFNNLTSKSDFLEGEYKVDPSTLNAPADGIKKFKVDIDLKLHSEQLNQAVKEAGFENGIPSQEIDDSFWAGFMNFLPIIIVLLVMFFIFRHQLKSSGRSAFSFGKSKAKMLNKDKNKVTFKNVAGVDEAKEEVQEIVEFLKDPKKFQKLGGKLPKGVLMVGPPGTGKTLLAKAIAGEADVPFYGISGSDFVEMFVGVGASRVRDMFEQGRKNAPCLIFIDEIDAVGRSRGHGLGGGHDEREQTLNAMLVEMDGIDTQDGVIIIAATNRKDVLDPALLRPGRFDREVVVSLPDVKGREQILNVHAETVKLTENVNWEKIARGTPGFSGAELANLINEGALIAAKHDAEAVDQHHLEEARDKVAWGRQRRSMVMTEKQKKLTAYHEAGHALLQVLLEHADPLEKVTIIPRTSFLGASISLPKDDSFLYGKQRQQLIDEMCVTMGGRVAEEMFLGDISTGASMDIRQATSNAKNMVCRWGMSESLGMVEYGENDDYVFLGREMGKSRGYSEETAKQIDSEVLAFTSSAYQRAKDLISEHKDQMNAIAEALLEYETLDGKHVEEIIKTGKLSSPPNKNIDPPSTPLPKEKLNIEPQEEEKKSDDDILPGLEGAPA